MLRVRLQSGIGDPFNTWMPFQKSGNSNGVFVMFLHPDLQGLGPAQSQPCLECSERRTRVCKCRVKRFEEGTGANDDAAYYVAVSVQVFCQAVNNYVSAKFEWPLK